MRAYMAYYILTRADTDTPHFNYIPSLSLALYLSLSLVPYQKSRKDTRKMSHSFVSLFLNDRQREGSDNFLLFPSKGKKKKILHDFLFFVFWKQEEPAAVGACVCFSLSLLLLLRLSLSNPKDRERKKKQPARESTFSPLCWLSPVHG